MTKAQTYEPVFHIAILFLLALGAFTAYLWLLPVGIGLEIAFWAYYCFKY